MQHIIFNKNPDNEYKVAILIKEAALKKHEILKHYLEPLGLDHKDCIAVSLFYNDKDKCPAKEANAYIEKLLKALRSLNTDYLLVCDGEYFKKLSGVSKVKNHHGEIYDCKHKDYNHMRMVLAANYKALFYNPDIQEKLDLSLKIFKDLANGVVTKLGENVIHSFKYPKSVTDIKNTLLELLKYDALSCDIETNSLRFNEAGIVTIGFAWDQHNGVAFCVERDNTEAVANNIKGLLKQFFEAYEGKIIWQNANYDTKVIVHELWMDSLLDQAGMIEGIQVMTKNIEDTKIITYLATNSTARNELDLKSTSHEFMGNYGVF